MKTSISDDYICLPETVPSWFFELLVW